MNRLAASNVCRVCKLNLRARLNGCDLVRFRAHWARMIVNGLCDDCQSDRFEAAMEYENALAQIRLVTYCGAGYSHHKPPIMHTALREAVNRRNKADARCVALKMWTERTYA